MWADVLNLLGLREDFKQLIIGEEIKACKNSSFLAEILIETSLDQFQIIVSILEIFEQSFSVASHEHIGVLLSFFNDFPPHFVNSSEFLVLIVELLHDIRRIKDGLEVHPGSLAFDPFIDSFNHVQQSRIPKFDFFFKWLFERRELHCLCYHNMLVKHSHGVVESDHCESSGILKWH